MRFPEFNDSGKLQLRKTQSSTEIFVENLKPAWPNPPGWFFLLIQKKKQKNWPRTNAEKHGKEEEAKNFYRKDAKYAK